MKIQCTSSSAADSVKKAEHPQRHPGAIAGFDAVYGRITIRNAGDLFEIFAFSAYFE